MGRRAELSDADFAAFEILVGFDLGLGEDALQPFGQRGGRDHGFRTAHLRADRAFPSTHRKVNIPGEKGADDSRAAAADENNLDIDAMFSEQSFFFGSPNAAVGSANGTKAEAEFLLTDRLWARQNNRQRQKGYAVTDKSFDIH